MINRIHDWLHERYIARLGYSCGKAIANDDRAKARLYWTLMLTAIRRRSPDQVRRMEQEMVSE